MNKLFLFATLISSLLILLSYIGFNFYNSNLFIFFLTFVVFSFFKISKSLFLFFEKHEKSLLLLVITSSVLILLRAGIIDEGIIAIQDFPIHYLIHHLIATKMIPYYQSINGMYLNYQLGYSPIYDHPPGGPLLTTLLWYATFKQIPFWAIFRFVVALSFILTIFSVYYLSKSLGFNSFVSILSALLWLSWFHEYFIDGTFISYYSLAFGLLSISFFVKYLEGRQNEKKKLILSGLFLAFSLLFQSMFYPFFLLLIFLLSLMKKSIKYFFIVLFVSFLVGFVYFTNFLVWDYSFQIFSRLPKIFPHLYDIGRSFWLHFYLLSVFPILISLPLILLKLPAKTGWKVDYLILSSIFLVLTVVAIVFI